MRYIQKTQHKVSFHEIYYDLNTAIKQCLMENSGKFWNVLSCSPLSLVYYSYRHKFRENYQCELVFTENILRSINTAIKQCLLENSGMFCRACFYLWFIIHIIHTFRENYQCAQGKAMATLDWGQVCKVQIWQTCHVVCKVASMPQCSGQ